MKTLIFTLLLFSASAFSAECLSYGSELSISGRLSRQTFAEQPNYETLAQGDAKATYFFVRLETPVCVDAGRSENNEPTEVGVKVMQLVFESTEESYSLLRPYLGRKVECRGSLLHAISGHHHSRIMIQCVQCKPVS